jgi:hypothetical protein
MPAVQGKRKEPIDMARSTPNIYTPSAGDITVAGATAIQEFFGFTADCGQAASEILYSWSQGKTPSGPHINAVVSAMQKAGLAGGGGVSTASGESKQLTNEGVANYTTTNWLAALQQNVQSVASGGSVHPVELLVNAPNLGANLPGDEFGVHGHFIAVEGWSPTHKAYVVSDPDNAAAKKGQLVLYTPQQIASANPIQAIVPTSMGKGIAGGGPGGTSNNNGSGGGGSGNQPNISQDNPWGNIPVLGGITTFLEQSGLNTLTSNTPTNPAAGVATTATGDTATALNPANWLAVIQEDIVKAGFLFFAALIILIGVVLLVAPSAVNAGTQIAAAAAAPETGGASEAIAAAARRKAAPRQSMV